LIFARRADAAIFDIDIGGGAVSVTSVYQLRAARALLGLSQPQVERKCDIPQHVISEIERGLGTSEQRGRLLAFYEAHGIRMIDGVGGTGVILQVERAHQAPKVRRGDSELQPAKM
jgi:transcriptional regulator with XRE-family HTH domain